LVAINNVEAFAMTMTKIIARSVVKKSRKREDSHDNFTDNQQG
jgi:hypothetical protein